MCSCPKIMQVWQRVLRLLILIHVNCVITWGAVRWGILEGQLLLYGKEDIVETFHIVPPYIQMVHLFLIDMLQIWDDINWKRTSSILIWKARCALVFDNVTQDVSAIILEFWLLFIHTLHGQYESFTWNNDGTIFRKQMHFKRLWDWMLFFQGRWRVTVICILLYFKCW